jgi:MFS transporter, SHS family, lactate transporter
LIGPSAAIALEDLPPDAQCLLSGLFEGGTSLGTLVASSMYRALVPTTPHGWRSLFWFGAGPPILIILLRWWLPETQHFMKIKAEREEKMQALKLQQSHISGNEEKRISELRTFAHESIQLIKHNWILLTYMFLLMTGFNACAHGAIDLYPTFLKNQVQMDPATTSIITITGNLGAFCGGITMGYISGIAGRRLTMLCNCVLGACILPAYILTRGGHNGRGMVICAPVFFQHFALIGIWGPIPIHLVELAPDALRTLMVGFTYQLGNLASSPITTIETYYGERYPLKPAANGTKRYDYGRAIMVFVSAAWAYMFLFLLLGPDSDRQDAGASIEGTYLDGLDSEPQSPADLMIEKGPIPVCDECDKEKRPAY